MISTKITNALNWETNSSRITIFPLFDEKKTVTPEFVSGLWPKSKETSLKNTNIAAETGQISLEGEFKNKRLFLIGTPFKIDLVVISKEPVNVTTVSLQTMGLFSETLIDINELVEKWFAQDNFPAIQRLAFAPELVSQVKSHEEAYTLISQYLPFSLEPKTSSDFKYQINKFTNSEVIKELKLNRVTAWDVLKINFQFATSQLAQQPIKYEDLYYCHLLLDINTDLEHKEALRKDKLSQLYQELVKHAITISKEGIK